MYPGKREMNVLVDVVGRVVVGQSRACSFVVGFRKRGKG